MNFSWALLLAVVAVCIVVDVTDEASVTDGFEKIIQTWGGIADSHICSSPIS